MPPKPYIDLTIGGYKGDLPPDTEFLKRVVDKHTQRIIVYVPVILNEIPRAGTPYTDRKGQRHIPSIIGQTNIRECIIQPPNPNLDYCTIKGFCSLQISGLSPDEVVERYAEAEKISQSGTALIFDWQQRQYKTVVSDETDDITTTHAFDAKPPNFGTESAQEINDEMTPPFNCNQSSNDRDGPRVHTAPASSF